MITLGIDLATEPKRTAACRVDWERRTIEVIDVSLDDDALVDLIAHASVTAIDVPLGWPDPFVEAMVAHRNLGPWPARERRRLAFRLTDEYVRDATGVTPLSVSTDRLGMTAMRGARVQHLLRARGVVVDRSGRDGALVEAYPAAALSRWGLPHRGYKSGDSTDRLRLLSGLVTEQMADLGSAIVKSLATHDQLDAVVCCLVARASASGGTIQAPDEDLERTRREGWIHLPTASISAISGSTARH